MANSTGEFAFMKSSRKNPANGTVRQAKGKMKEEAGEMTRSARLAGRDHMESTPGRLQRRVARVVHDVEETGSD